MHRECRYSSCEMMYVEVGAWDVRFYADHSKGNANYYSFQEVLDGAMDNEIGGVFGSEILAELKDEVRRLMAR